MWHYYFIFRDEGNNITIRVVISLKGLSLFSSHTIQDQGFTTIEKRIQSKNAIARSGSNVEGTHRYCHSGEYRTWKTGEIDSLQYSRVSKRSF